MFPCNPCSSREILATICAANLFGMRRKSSKRVLCKRFSDCATESFRWRPRFSGAGSVIQKAAGLDQQHQRDRQWQCGYAAQQRFPTAPRQSHADRSVAGTGRAGRDARPDHGHAASTAAVYGAALYTARLAKAAAPTVFVDTQQQTVIRFMFSDLTPGELYNVDINAIGAAGPSDFSDVGTLRLI